MITYRNFNESDLADVVKMLNEEFNKQGFYKPFTNETFRNHLLLNFEYRSDGTFVALHENKIVGFISSTIRHIEENDETKPGYLVCIMVKSNYRKQGIGSKLIALVEGFLRKYNKKHLMISYTSTINFPWYIPNTDKHDHAGAPGVSVNSELYLFLINHNFEVVDHQDAFHLDLSDYQMPEEVKTKIEKNKKLGYNIEIYNPTKHYGLEEFYHDINAEPFERVIKANLKLAKPNPFFVVSHNGKIVGWTGAMWTETSGRAHFDGIIIAPSVRGLGIGQALFCSLGLYSKEHGSKFMTFFTGRHNSARYIYMKAGFKIIQSFAIMEKGIK